MSAPVPIVLTPKKVVPEPEIEDWGTPWKLSFCPSCKCDGHVVEYALRGETLADFYGFDDGCVNCASGQGISLYCQVVAKLGRNKVPLSGPMNWLLEIIERLNDRVRNRHQELTYLRRHFQCLEQASDEILVLERENDRLREQMQQAYEYAGGSPQSPSSASDDGTSQQPT